MGVAVTMGTGTGTGGGVYTLARRVRGIRAFVLLEVLVAIVIVAVAFTALMRGYVLSLDGLRKVRMNEQAIYLAQSFMDDLIVEPPAEERATGSFGDDPRYGEAFKDWSWELRVEADEPDYRERPRGKLSQDLEQIYVAHLRILHTNRHNETQAYVDVHTILMEPDVFSPQAIEENQLF